MVIVLLAMFLVFSEYVNREKSQVPYDQVSNSEKIVRPLPIPPLLEDTNKSENISDFEITAKRGTKSFFKGSQSSTLGYNGNFLGPTIRVQKGERVNMRVNNALDESTTVHWHGLHVAGPGDGGPHQVIAPGKSWRPSFNIVQEAATLWYHPHPKGLTGRQVYKGLAGFFIIDDDRSLNLNLPKEYGKNDIPLVIQDRRFNANGQLEYETSFIYSRNGMFGDKVLVNGKINPTLGVGTAKIRLRVLNGSNTRIYNLSLSDRSTFVQIASDGGFLNRPVKLRSLEISPGERAEIVIDFSKYSVGDSIRLKDPRFDIMQFIVNKRVQDKTTIPTRIGDVKKIPRSAAVRKRTFVLRSAGGGVAKQDLTINGKLFDLKRIDETVGRGDTEIWEIRNPSSPGENLSLHPLHIHGIHFQILSRNGRAPAENERGWKDTLLLHKDETAKLIMRFEDFKGVYMYHCHMLEHEDAGMMAQFEIK